MKKSTFLIIVLLLCMMQFTFGSSGTNTCNLRPLYVDVSSATSQSAVLMTAGGYFSDLVRYRLPYGSSYHYVWNVDSSSFIKGATYSSNPLIPGTPTISSTWWIIYQAGTNKSGNTSYIDRLPPAYSGNYHYIPALPTATEITVPFNLSGSVSAGGSNDLTVKYVVLGWDGTTLVSATSTDLTTGVFSLTCPEGITISKIEIRKIDDSPINEKNGSWTITTAVGDISLGLTSYPEPTSHVTDFTASFSDFKSITLTWTGSTGAQLPSKYLILGKRGAGTYASVSDFTPVADDQDWSDNNAAITILHASGSNSYTFTGLTGETVYSFVIYPCTNSEGNIDYKTDGTVPSAQMETTAQPALYSDFTSDLGGFTAVNVTSNITWTYLSGTAYMNNESGDVAANDWLVSSSLNLNNYLNPVLTFQSWTQNTDGIIPGLELKITIAYTGDVSTTTWTTLTADLSPSNSATWTPSGNINLSTYSSADVRIAFHYTSSGIGSGNATSWKIDDVLIQGDRISTFTATADNDYSNPLNWTNGVPSKFVKVYISGLSIITGSVECAGMQIESTGKLTVNSGASLNINGNLVLKATPLSKGSGTPCSFVQLGTVNYVSASVEQGFPNAAQWYYFSIPVSSALASEICNVATDELYEYNTAAPAWSRITDPSAVLNPARGYALRLTAPKMITFSGSFNEGYVSANLTNTGNNWWLVGNPYPSAIDFGAENSPVSGWTISDVLNTYYIRTNGTFASYNWAGDGLGANGGSRYVANSQAIWVKVTGSSPFFDMSNEIRLHNGVSFLKVKTLSPYIRLAVANGTYIDETLIRFNSESLAGQDKFDSEKKSSEDIRYAEIYTLIGTDKMVINTMPEIAQELIVPLGFRCKTDGEFSISATEFENMNSNMKVLLIDHLANKVIDLRTTEHYTFSSQVTDNTDRFAIHFINGDVNSELGDNGAGLGIDENISNRMDIVAQGKIIRITTPVSEGKALVYNFTGQLVSSAVIHDKITTIEILQSGCYLVKITSANKTITRKIYIR